MDKLNCGCDDKKTGLNCPACDSAMPLLYWCETCQRQGPDKRCPGCGLKTRKVRRNDHR